MSIRRVTFFFFIASAPPEIYFLTIQPSQRFYRMWRYFLLSSAGSDRARRNQLWQIVYSKKGLDGGYESIR